MTSEKFCVHLDKHWPDYFENFVNYCNDLARENDWRVDTVINYQLRPLGGRLIKTRTQGMYLRWDTEQAHTLFVLRWQ